MMYITRYWLIGTVGIALTLMFITVVFAQSKQSKTASYTVAALVRSTRDKNLRYFVRDLKKGIGKTASVKQSFIAFKNATDDVFLQYDAVIVYNQGASLEEAILPFIEKHKDNPKIIVVLFHPSSGPEDIPKGIDVLTSASRYIGPKFMIGPVTQRVLAVLQ